MVAVLYEAAPSVRAEPDKESPLGKLPADKVALAGSTSTCDMVKFLGIPLCGLELVDNKRQDVMRRRWPLGL